MRVHTGPDARAISKDLVEKFGAFAPEVTHPSVINHGLHERHYGTLHDSLVRNGWTHDRVDRYKTELHTYRHPDGGHIAVTRRDGSSTLSGKTRYIVDAHGATT